MSRYGVYRVIYDPSGLFNAGATLLATSLRLCRDDDLPNGLRLRYDGPGDSEPCGVLFYGGHFYKDWPLDFGTPGVDGPELEPWTV